MCTSTCTVPCLGGRHNYAPPPPPPPSALASMQYPLYDRSGVDDDEIPVSRIAAKVAKKECDIHVCHAGTCRSRGAEAVLTEIEELVNADCRGGASQARRRRRFPWRPGVSVECLCLRVHIKTPQVKYVNS
jgi:hypothetical protein